MQTLSQSKTCVHCNSPIQGRSDKKFCDDSCRNAYNNIQNSSQNNYIRRVTYCLLRNRRILAEYLPLQEKMARASLDHLQRKGFQTEFFTNLYENKKGQKYYFSFDYGYLLLDAHSVLIVRKK